MSDKEKDLRQITKRLKEVSQETKRLFQKVKRQEGKILVAVVMGFHHGKDLDVSVSLGSSKDLELSLSDIVHLLEKAKSQVEDEINLQDYH